MENSTKRTHQEIASSDYSDRSRDSDAMPGIRNQDMSLNLPSAPTVRRSRIMTSPDFSRPMKQPKLTKPNAVLGQKPTPTAPGPLLPSLAGPTQVPTVPAYGTKPFAELSSHDLENSVLPGLPRHVQRSDLWYVLTITNPFKVQPVSNLWQEWYEAHLDKMSLWENSRAQCLQEKQYKSNPSKPDVAASAAFTFWGIFTYASTNGKPELARAAAQKTLDYLMLSNLLVQTRKEKDKHFVLATVLPEHKRWWKVRMDQVGQPNFGARPPLGALIGTDYGAVGNQLGVPYAGPRLSMTPMNVHQADTIALRNQVEGTIVRQKYEGPSFEMLVLAPNLRRCLERILDQARCFNVDRRDGHSEGVDSSMFPNGTILAGLPGVGKTTIAQAMAAELNANFYEVKVGDMRNQYVGVSDKFVNAIFQHATEHAPAVIFVDEVDTFTSTAGAALRRELTVTKRDCSRILFMGATDRLHEVQHNILRGMEHRILIELPGQAERALLLELYTEGRINKKLLVEMSRSPALENFSADDIENLIRRARVSLIDEVKAQGYTKWKKTLGTLCDTITPVFDGEEDPPPNALIQKPMCDFTPAECAMLRSRSSLKYKHFLEALDGYPCTNKAKAIEASKQWRDMVTGPKRND